MEKSSSLEESLQTITQERDELRIMSEQSSQELMRALEAMLYSTVTVTVCAGHTPTHTHHTHAHINTFTHMHTYIHIHTHMHAQ